MRARLAAVGLFAASCLAACGGSNPSAAEGPTAPASSFQLVIANFDGPPVSVKVNDRLVASRVLCELEATTLPPVLLPGPDLPLPWKVVVVKGDGTVMGSWTETGQGGDREIVIRGNAAWESPVGESQGPVPVSCPTQ
jgi:hypothetical protein